MRNFIPKIIDQYAGGSNGKPLFEPKVVDFPQILNQPVVKDMNPIQKFFNKFSQKGGAIITLPDGGKLDVVTPSEVQKWKEALELDAKENDRKNNKQSDFIRKNMNEIESLKKRVTKLESSQPNPTVEERLSKLENEAKHDNIQDSKQQQQINQNKNVFQRLLGFV
jgi:hypothetical protein